MQRSGLDGAVAFRFLALAGNNHVVSNDLLNFGYHLDGSVSLFHYKV
jgi:hypothetical protein